jgi:2-polyprenyl-3-methyl-5-hydroxy-6-metoxy-1,4-benzoquinol methylase
MLELLNECPICGNSSFTSFLKCVDYTVSRETFEIVSCSKCEFKFTNPRPDINSIEKYYESPNYVSHTNTKTGLINKLYHIIKVLAIKSKIALIENLQLKNKRILDIGCGTGTFLGQIKNRGWNVKGIEPSQTAREIAIKDFNIPVDAELNIDKLGHHSFSVITMWHVLEHIHLLEDKVLEIFNLLEKEGYAVIAVPNNISWDAKHYKSYWAAYDVPRHLSHFAPSNIKTLFTENGFKYVKSLPMKFDSFYVSMLSEKNKKALLGVAKAFIKGLVSNLKAKNAEEYSSVIYIFQKQ